MSFYGGVNGRNDNPSYDQSNGVMLYSDLSQNSDPQNKNNPYRKNDVPQEEEEEAEEFNPVYYGKRRREVLKELEMTFPLPKKKLHVVKDEEEEDSEEEEDEEEEFDMNIPLAFPEFYTNNPIHGEVAEEDECVDEDEDEDIDDPYSLTNQEVVDILQEEEEEEEELQNMRNRKNRRVRPPSPNDLTVSSSSLKEDDQQQQPLLKKGRVSKIFYTLEVINQRRSKVDVTQRLKKRMRTSEYRNSKNETRSDPFDLVERECGTSGRNPNINNNNQNNQQTFNQNNNNNFNFRGYKNQSPHRNNHRNNNNNNNNFFQSNNSPNNNNNRNFFGNSNNNNNDNENNNNSDDNNNSNLNRNNHHINNNNNNNNNNVTNFFGSSSIITSVDHTNHSQQQQQNQPNFGNISNNNNNNFSQHDFLGNDPIPISGDDSIDSHPQQHHHQQQQQQKEEEEEEERVYRPPPRKRRKKNDDHTDDSGRKITQYQTSPFTGTQGRLRRPNFPDMLRINQIFDQYRSNEHEIGCLGMQKLRLELGMDPGQYHNFLFFCLVYRLNCKSRFHIKRTEWVKGLVDMNCDDLRKIRSVLTRMKGGAYHQWSFEDVKKFFTFVFRYQLDSEQSRNLSIHVAVNTLKCLMMNHSPFIDTFSEFVTKEYQFMNLDQFKIFVDFSKTIRRDFSNFDIDEGAWPTMYDEYYKAMTGKNDPKMEISKEGDEE